MCIIEIPFQTEKERRGVKMYSNKLCLKISKSKEVNRHPVTGSTEGSKQEPEQMHTKTYNKENGKVKDTENSKASKKQNKESDKRNPQGC